MDKLVNFAKRIASLDYAVIQGSDILRDLIVQARVAINEFESMETKTVVKKKFGKADFKQALIDKGCAVQDVEDWCTVRSVFTKRALDGFIKECESNNFSIAEAVKVAADKGWKGFEVKWLTKGGNEQYKGNNSTGNKPYTFDIGRASETLFSQGTGGLSTDKEGQ